MVNNYTTSTLDTNLIGSVQTTNVVSVTDSLSSNITNKIKEVIDPVKPEYSNKETPIFAVVGANYGDEGKGGVTHWLSSRFKKGQVLNVLYNGGMQRGHTVQYGYKRHVFHCYGSGTFVRAKTYWAKSFLVDPEAAKIEYDSLFEDAPDIIFAHPKCRIVTPWDIITNRYKERFRGSLRHGSCGMGIFETIERDKKISLSLSECFNVFNLYSKLREIEKYYYQKFIEMGLPEDFQKIVEEISIDNFIVSVNWLKSKVVIMESPWNIEWDAVIFEGGQGLALSQSNKADFPHLTPSYTGSEEIVKMCGNRSISVFYVTRPYFTRHGAGPLPNENKNIKKLVLEDKTNESNEFQGTLRYAYFNSEAIKARIKKDITLYSKRPWVTLCMSQSEDGAALIDITDDKVVYASVKSDFVGIIDEMCLSEIQEDNIVITYTY